MKQRTGPLAHLEEHLAQLEREGLRRIPPSPRPPGERSFCSNDYLGLAGLPPPSAPSGSGASRLIAGERAEHRSLERALATWLGVDDALVFSSGYAANVGALSSILGPDDLLVSDVLNHASLIDGARLSRARIEIVSHNDVDAVARALGEREEARAWVAVESYYSMDADGPDLVKLRQVCDAHGAGLLVDEAHALGILGPSGRGRCAEAGITPDALVGTLGKALGSQGAFVAGAPVLREYLWNRARSFVFSTGLAPASCAATLRSLQRVIEDPAAAPRVATLASRLREGLARAASAKDGFSVRGFGHIIPVVTGHAEVALRLAAAMRDRGIDVHAIRPPTVPTGTSRIRFTVTALHSEADIDAAIAAFAGALAACQ